MKVEHIYIGHQKGNITEGGMARNKAFLNYAHARKYRCYNVYSEFLLLRIIKLLHILIKTLFWRNRKILLHMGTLFIIFPIKLLNFTFGFFLFKIYFHYLIKNNKVYLEINDIPLEQAVDLNLRIEPFYELFQKVIFNPKLNLNYIFAANGMQNYIINKYNIDPLNSQVIINGAPLLERTEVVDFSDKLSDKLLKFVYAGTAKKGRGLEELLEVFKNIPHSLVIIGDGGEWISDLHYNNILYLGAYSENIALNLVSHCDMGIVHYDKSKFYYNICYPTKYSFYLSAGLPILSTELKESMDSFGNLTNQICIFSKMDNWKSIIANLDKSKIELLRNNVNEIKDKYSWSYIMSKLIIR